MRTKPYMWTDNPPSFFVVLLAFFSPFVNAGEAHWSCLESAYHSIYESVELSESRVARNPQTLKWVDKDTIGFDSVTLRRSSVRSNTFIQDERDFKVVHVNDKETPHLVVFIEPQTWMNKFGNLRVRFYRCTP